MRRWTVGRNKDCDVVVDDEYAAGQHCEVAELDDGRFAVRDLGSTNGTRIRTTHTNLIGEPRSVDIRIYDWTIITPGQALVVGRSVIPWAPQ